jgi:DNA processing protein
MNYNKIQKLSEKDQINWLRLARTHNIGPKTFFKILSLFNSLEEAINNVPHFARRGGAKKPVEALAVELAEKEILITQKNGAQIIPFCDENYPKLLREIYDPPALITCKGNIDIFNNSILAIAGPRNASLNGKKFAYKIANDLGNYNMIISSGMARGIDSYAHQGALKKGTIAVLAGGIDNIYPSENKNLYHQILENGLIISENAFGTIPKSINFPKRNRIISGISLGLIVVEAGMRSGTLITARYAIEQNREIMAVPGSPFDYRCHGSNRLIKDGAKLIENAEDVMQEINNLTNNKDLIDFLDSEDKEFNGFAPKIPEENELDSAKKEILQNLSHSPVALEELLSITEIPTNIANIILIQLELADIIENNHDMINFKEPMKN